MTQDEIMKLAVEACAKVMESGVLGHGECAAAIRAINFEGDTGFRPVSEMVAEHKQDPKKAAAIEKAKMRKAEQKPVAWRVHPFDYGVGHEGAYAMTMRLEQVEAWNRKGWIVEPLYAAPVSAEAIRSEALEEAAKVCRTAQAKGLQSIREAIEAAIRGLK